MKHLKPTLDLFEITPYLFEGVIFTDDEGFIHSINKAVLDFFPRLKHSDLIGKRINDLVLSKDLEMFFNNKQEMRNITLSIGMNQLLANLRFIDDKNVLLVLKNITSIQQLSTELNDAQMHIRLFHSILDALDEGVCFIDNNRKIIFYNRKMGELDSKEPIGVRERPYTTLVKEATQHQDPLLNSLTTDRKIVQNESFFSNSGKRYIVNRISEPLFLGNRKIGAFSIVKDFSKKEAMLASIYNLKKATMTLDATLPPTKQRKKINDFSNKTMKKTILDAEKASHSSSNVLIYGETGVGKNILGDFIATHSKQVEPYHSINCGAIPDLLLEEILFGNSTSEGLLWGANGGTLLLDEVSKMSLRLQEKVLRVIQDQQLFRYGETTASPVNIRFIALLDEKPNTALKKRHLLEDIFYALSGIALNIPPLRDRKEDIPLLVQHFINEQCTVSDEAIEILSKYSYPGNIRQLEFIIEGAIALLLDEKVLLPEHLPTYIYERNDDRENLSISIEQMSSLPLTEQVEAFEKELIVRMLKKTNSHITNAAEKLGLSRQSLNYKIRKYDIEIIRGDD